jgi:dTDP-4-dehydrorhamnose reductase
MTPNLIAVAGESGQVATALRERAKAAGLQLVCLGRSSADLADPASFGRALKELSPSLVVNAAAYTAVDQAESDRDNAFAINATGPGALATITAELGVPIIHLSTDYVFDGTKSSAYTEADPTAPLGVYGASKLEGEQLVAANNPRHLILRTAWVFSPFGKNFAKTMLRLAGTRDEVGVVHDQIGNPTSAHDIADTVLKLAGMAQDEAWGVYHMSGSGQASWAEFAERIFAASRKAGGPFANVKRIGTADFPTPTQRPANSRLDCTRLRETFGIVMPDWQDSTDVCVQRIVEEKVWQS